MAVLNVTESPYNAAGDGTTDDRAAIQAAIDDATGGDTVYLPANTYALEEWDDDPHWGSSLYIGANKEGDVFSIEGDGPETVLKFNDGDTGKYSPAVLSVNPGEADSGKLDVDVKNLVIDGNHRDGGVDSARGVDIHQDYSSSSVEEVTTGHDIYFEDVEIRDTTSTGFWMRSGWDDTLIGCDKVHAKRLTIDTTARSHGLSIQSATNPKNEADIVNTFESVRILNPGGSDSNPGNGINMNGTALFKDIYIENAHQGTKVSNAGIHPVIRNAHFYGHHDIHTPVLRETVTDNRGDWSLTLDTIRIAQADNAAMRFGGGGGGTPNVEISDIECIACDLDGNQGYVIGITDDQNVSANSVHVGDTPSDGISVWGWSGDVAESDTVTHQNVSGTPVDSSFSAGTTSEETAPGLAVPQKSEVGAFTGDEETSSPDDGDGTQEGVFTDWTPQWSSTTDDWSVRSGSEYEGEAALVFEDVDGNRTRQALSWDQVGTQSDVEVVDRFRVPQFHGDNGSYHARIYLRGGTSSGGENAYWLQAEDTDSGSFRLGKHVDGSLVTLDQFGTLQEGTFYYRRFRVEGDRLMAKVWEAGGSEPESWDTEVTDGDLVEGWVGLGSFDPEVVEFDRVSVATDGRSADAGTPDGSPAVSWVTPASGTTVDGTITVQISASDSEDADDSLVVEYRIDGGSWQSAVYNADTGYYEDSWDTTGVSDGDHTLEASATDSSGNSSTTSVTVTTDNSGSSPTVEQLSLSEVETSSSDAEFDAEWQVSDADADLDSVDLLLTDDSDGSTEDTATVSVSGDAANSTTRLVASGDDGSANSYTVELQVTDGAGNTASETAASTETEDGGSTPTVNRFSVSEAGRPNPHADITVLWDVTDEDGDLATVDIDIADADGTVQSVTWTIGGSTASDTDSFKIKKGDGKSYDVTMTVTDEAGHSRTKTGSVTA